MKKQILALLICLVSVAVAHASVTLEDIVSNLDSKYCIFSYNNEGFISKEDMEKMLSKYGNVKTTAIEYNTFRGCRNLRERNLKTREYLFVLKKR